MQTIGPVWMITGAGRGFGAKIALAALDPPKAFRPLGGSGACGRYAVCAE